MTRSPFFCLFSFFFWFLVFGFWMDPLSSSSFLVFLRSSGEREFFPSRIPSKKKEPPPLLPLLLPLPPP